VRRVPAEVIKPPELGMDHYFFGGGMQNPERNCLQNPKSPNKLFADMKRRK